MDTGSDLTKSAFWVRKMLRIFSIVDIDKDGVLSSEDCMGDVHSVRYESEAAEGAPAHTLHKAVWEVEATLASRWIEDSAGTLPFVLRRCCHTRYLHGPN